MPVRAVIFDYKALLAEPGTQLAIRISALLDLLRYHGLQICIFSTEPLTTAQSCILAALGCSPVDHYISKSYIQSGKNRGSPDWVKAASQVIGIDSYEFLYIGTTILDWRTAINAGVFYMHASWAKPMPPGSTSLVATDPNHVRDLLLIFLLSAPSWAYRLDGPQWTFRSLLSASAVLPCTSPAQSFRLQDVFTYARSIEIGHSDARNILMLFVLANAYLEGALPANLYFTIYPSCRPGVVSEQLRAYLDPAAKLFHGYYREDLIIRAMEAPDTSLLRWRARHEGTTADISIATQATTVCLGSNYRGKLRGKTVVVFDDFTTRGMSLEWARTLLTAVGVKHIVLLTVGKYGSLHTHYSLRPEFKFDPYALNTHLRSADFDATTLRPRSDPDAEQHIADAIRILVGER